MSFDTQTPSGIDELTYKDKFLGDENIKQLCERLKLDERKKLVLRGNYIGVTGAKAIADLLVEQNSLVFVSLEWNIIGSTGAQYFAQALQSNRSLAHLDLRNNSINNEAAIALAEAIIKNKTLKTLDLRWNQIEDRGALAFKDAILERKPSLNLLINGNLLSESAIATINAWLQKGKEYEEIPDVAISPKKEGIPKSVEIEFLQKENYSLRQQLIALQTALEDYQRQMTSSAYRITELEQLVAREQYSNSQLQDSVANATLRISILNDEISSLSAKWEKDRSNIVSDMIVTVKEKEKEILELTLDRDNIKDKLAKCTDEKDQIRMQYESIQEQLTSDRIINQNELKLAYTRINDYALSETKLKAENSALKSTNARLVEKLIMLEADLELNRKELSRLVQQEHDYYVIELQKLKGDHSNTMNILMEKNNIQAKEIAELQALVAALRSELGNQRLELEDAYECAIKSARESERKQAELIINDLRQRLDAITLLKNDLELKCQSYLKQIQAQQEDHESAIKQLQQHIHSLQEELNQLRNHYNTSKTTIVGLESFSRTQDIEIHDLRKRLVAAEDQGDKWYRELQIANTAKINMSNQLEKLQQQYQQLKSSRTEEYTLITKNVLNAVRAEFDSMKVDLKLIENRSNFNSN